MEEFLSNFVTNIYAALYKNCSQLATMKTCNESAIQIARVALFKYWNQHFLGTNQSISNLLQNKCHVMCVFCRLYCVIVVLHHMVLVNVASFDKLDKERLGTIFAFVKQMVPMLFEAEPYRVGCCKMDAGKDISYEFFNKQLTLYYTEYSVTSCIHLVGKTLYYTDTNNYTHPLVFAPDWET